MAGTNTIVPPAYLANAVANIYTPAASTIVFFIRHIHIANVTAGAESATLYRGATGGSAAGTELLKGYSIAAHGEYDRYWGGQGLKMTSTDFLTGLASAATALVITVIGDQFVV